MIKKVITIMTVACMVLSLATCFASSGEEAFVDAITTGINADSMWGSVTPIAEIIIFVFLFAFAYKILRRVLKKGSNGKFGM